MYIILYVPNIWITIYLLIYTYNIAAMVAKRTSPIYKYYTGIVYTENGK